MIQRSLAGFQDVAVARVRWPIVGQVAPDVVSTSLLSGPTFTVSGTCRTVCPLTFLARMGTS